MHVRNNMYKGLVGRLQRKRRAEECRRKSEDNIKVDFIEIVAKI